MSAFEWDALVILGFGLAVVGSVSCAVGMALLKSSSVYEHSLPFHRRLRWLVGTGMLTVINPCLDAGAYTYAPLTLIAPLGGLSLLATVLMARVGFAGVQERPTPLQWLLFLAICVGIGMASVAGPHDTGGEGLHELDSRFADAPFLPWFTTTTAGLAFWVVFSIHAQRWSGWARRRERIAVADAVAAGLAGAHTALLLKLSIYAIRAWRSGVFTAKEIVDIPCVSVAVSTLLPVAGAQLYLMNTSLAHAPLCFGVPIYMTTFSLLTVGNGCLLFHEVRGLDAARIGVFAGGTALCLVSVFALGVLRGLEESSAHARASLVRNDCATATAAAPVEAVAELASVAAAPDTIVDIDAVAL